MHRLAGTDAAMLYSETRELPMYACTLTVLDPASASQPFDVERFRELMVARSDRLEPFRQRLVTIPLGLDRPVWVDGGTVDVAAHIRAIAVPRPGTPRQVGELLSDLIAQPLPHDRPLWQCWFIEGLEQGHVGVFCKVHHALVGGTRAMALYELLFDLDPLALQATGDLVGAERSPRRLALAGHAAWSLAQTPLRVARAIPDLAGAAFAGLRFHRGDHWADVAMPFQSPTTSLNGAVGAARSCAFCTISMIDVKAIKRAAGVKVNDVVLAVVGGALRRYLQERGELPDVALSASVPISVDAGGTGGTDSGSLLGNTVSNFGASLATNIQDPVERLHRIAASTRAAKELHSALGDDLILRLADILPPGLSGAFTRALSSRPVAALSSAPYSVIVSNLPGPGIPLYSGGARLVGSYVFGPLIQGFGLNITVLSYVDELDIGVNVCPSLVPDPWTIAGLMSGELEELRSAVEERGEAT